MSPGFSISPSFCLAFICVSSNLRQALSWWLRFLPAAPDLFSLPWKPRDPGLLFTNNFRKTSGPGSHLLRARLQWLIGLGFVFTIEVCDAPFKWPKNYQSGILESEIEGNWSMIRKKRGSKCQVIKRTKWLLKRVRLYIYIFIRQIFIEHLLYPGNCVRCWNTENKIKSLHSRSLYSSEEKTGNKQIRL